MGSRGPPHLEVKKEFRIKKETPDDEIKEYAETAMNEFLGWYGYDKVDSTDTQGLNLHHFASRRRLRRSLTEDDSSDAERGRSCSPPRRENPPSPSRTPESTSNGYITCCWCNKATTHKSFSLKTPTGHKMFCSELCFTQCRRANFKRNKTCDWCRHIRHTVNYVDFQDGEHQLQFCSDKCLNQYKMNIFCKETEAHLQLHPHLAETSGSKGSGTAVGLITPELWLRDCRSESPSSERTPSPPAAAPPPMIEISKVERKEEALKEKKRGIKNKKLKIDHRECSPRRKETVSPPKPPQSYPPSLLPINGAHMNIIPPNMATDSLGRPPFLNLGFFSHPPMFPPDHSVLRNGPRFPLIKPHMISPPTPPPVINPPPPLRHPAPIPSKSLLPPVTILVPYPIPLPIPIPIPIPLPLFLDKQKTYETKVSENLTKEEEEEIILKTENLDTLVPKSSSPTLPPLPPTTSVPLTTKEESPSSEATNTIIVSPSTSVPRPLRKRKRVTEITQDGESSVKRKTVPV